MNPRQSAWKQTRLLQAISGSHALPDGHRMATPHSRFQGRCLAVGRRLVCQQLRPLLPNGLVKLRCSGTAASWSARQYWRVGTKTVGNNRRINYWSGSAGDGDSRASILESPANLTTQRHL